MKSKKIKLFNYKNEKKYYTIKNLSKIKLLILEIISGDQILTVVYKNNTIEQMDTGENRLIDLYDGEWLISPKDIDKINKMKNNYDIEVLL